MLGGSLLSGSLLNRRMHVVVEGSSSGFSDIISGVLQGSVHGPLLFNLYTADLFNNNNTVKLVISQARVSLIKQVILPQLESTAAIIGARLLAFVRDVYSIDQTQNI